MSRAALCMAALLLASSGCKRGPHVAIGYLSPAVNASGAVYDATAPEWKTESNGADEEEIFVAEGTAVAFQVSIVDDDEELDEPVTLTAPDDPSFRILSTPDPTIFVITGLEIGNAAITVESPSTSETVVVTVTRQLEPAWTE